MALKGKPIAIGTSATTIYTCPAGVESAVHGLIFSNNSASPLVVTVQVFNQADNTTTTVATNLSVPANSYITWTKPVNMNAGDTISALASASGIVCLFSVYEGSAAPVAIGFTGRGIWASGSSYSTNDIVTVAGSGTYLALQPSVGQNPTSASAYWMFLEGISASALPSQSGQAGKFLTTDGTDASWAVVDVAGGAEVTNPMSSNVTLNSASKRVQVLYPSAAREVTLPVASTLTLGESFVIANKGTASLTVRNSSNALLAVIMPSNAAKMLLANTATSDWEAFSVPLAGAFASLSTGATPINTPYSFPYIYSPVLTKLSATRYQLFNSVLNPSTAAWGYLNHIFDLDSSLNYASVSANYVDVSYGPTGSGAGLNFIVRLGDGVFMSGGYNTAGPANGTTHLVEASEAVATPVIRHTHTGPAQDSYSNPVARLSNRRGIVFYTSFIGTFTNIGTHVIDYSSSLTSPTVGSLVNFATGGTHSPVGSDAEALEDNKVLLAYNARTGTTGDTYEKRVVVCTVSGTTPTFHTPLVLTPSRVASASIKLRVLSATKAIVAWVEGRSLVGRIITVSANTLTAGDKFTLISAGFSTGGTIDRGLNDNEFYVLTQSTTDNGCFYMSRFVLSGSAYVSNSAYAKIINTISAVNNSHCATAIYDSDKVAYTAILAGNPFNYAVVRPTEI